MRYSLTDFGGEALGNHFAASHAKFKVLLQKSCGVITLLLLLAAAASAQSDTAGSTPLGLAPGAPAGSYSLSSFDNVNLFNGNLNFHLPLLGVSGRGGAGYQMTLPIDQTWTVFRQKNEITGVVTHYPEPNWWDGIKPGYSPGVVQARHGGDGSVYCGPSRLGYTRTLTRLTFTAADGTTNSASYQRFVIRADKLDKEKIRLDQDFPSARYSLILADEKIYGVYNNWVMYHCV